MELSKLPVWGYFLVDDFPSSVALPQHPSQCPVFGPPTTISYLNYVSFVKAKEVAQQARARGPLATCGCLRQTIPDRQFRRFLTDTAEDTIYDLLDLSEEPLSLSLSG